MTLKQAMSRSQSHPTGESRAPAASDHAGSVGSSPAILQSAARHVILQWRQRIGETPAAPEIDDLMVVLATSIVETQITAAPVIDERVRSSVGRHLLEQLRREVVRRWTESGVADSELPPLLVAIERVRDALEPTPTEAFALRLGGPEGMELLVDVAHDLRSPLTSILFLAETMQRGQSGPISDVQRRQLGLIYSTALGLSSVASDLIDLSRSDQLVEPAPIPFSVTGVLESVHNIVRPMVEEKKVALRQAAARDGLDATTGKSTGLGHPIVLRARAAALFIAAEYATPHRPAAAGTLGQRARIRGAAAARQVTAECSPAHCSPVRGPSGCAASRGAPSAGTMWSDRRPRCVPPSRCCCRPARRAR